MHQSQTVLGFSSLGAVSVCVGVCAVYLFSLSKSVYAACVCLGVYATVCVRAAGLAFDSWDLDYYTSMFQRINRNPTSVECFDLAQSNRWGGGIPHWASSLFLFLTRFLCVSLCVPASTAATGSSAGGWWSTGRSSRRPSSASSWTPSGTATRITSSSSATTAGGVGRRSWARGFMGSWSRPRPLCETFHFSVQWHQRRGAAVHLPSRPLGSEPVRDAALVATRYLHCRDAQLPNRSAPTSPIQSQVPVWLLSKITMLSELWTLQVLRRSAAPPRGPEVASEMSRAPDEGGTSSLGLRDIASETCTSQVAHYAVGISCSNGGRK